MLHPTTHEQVLAAISEYHREADEARLKTRAGHRVRRLRARRRRAIARELRHLPSPTLTS